MRCYTPLNAIQKVSNMLSSLRRSFGMSPSSSNLQAEQAAANDVPTGVLSPSSKPNTFIPLRRSNSFTNFFSSSRPSSPAKENLEQDAKKAAASTNASSSAAAAAEVDPAPILAFLVLLDKKGRQKNRYPIQSLKTTMGRSPDNDVRFLVSDVSRLHCTIEIEIEQEQAADGTKAFLQVLGANGVRLNETQAFPAPRGAGRYRLHCGDSIVIAKRSFLFELPQPSAGVPSLFLSPVKGCTPSGVSQSPAKRRVRMSLVNAAQIDTPARPAARQASSPAKGGNAADREARRANGLQRFMQSTNFSPSKANKKKARQSLTSSTSMTDVFATPVKSRSAALEPKTAPSKQVSFNLYAHSYSARLSPVKQMRMMPPLDTMSEEQDGSFRSDNGQQEQERMPNEVREVDADQEGVDLPRDESSEDIVYVEEFEQEIEQPDEATTAAKPDLEAIPDQYDSRVQSADDSENSENIGPSTPSSNVKSNGSPSKGGSPKRPKRRSSFFGRAGPFRGINLGFYAEERTDTNEAAEDAPSQASGQEMPAQQTEEQAEKFSDATDEERLPMDEEALPAAHQASPIAQRVSSKPLKLGISKTPSPVKMQHFVDLTPLPRRPRLSSTTLRRVSLRTHTLLRSSEAYADRLFLPPPPSTPIQAGPSSLSKSISMPSALSLAAPIQSPSAFDTSLGIEHEGGSDGMLDEVVHEDEDMESHLDPALSEGEAMQWKDSDEDEDEVDKSLSVFSPSPKKAPAYLFSPVKTSALPPFATPQPMSRTHIRRLSVPPAVDANSSKRSALVRLQISGAGERIVHEASERSRANDDRSIAEHSSPTKSRKVVRVSDVGLPATEVAMGFDVIQDSAADQEPERIAEALNELFTAEKEELTDDEEPTEEEDEEGEEQQEQIVQVTSRAQESPSRQCAAIVTSLQPPQTPAALNSVRQLFSTASAAPATPDTDGLASMLHASPGKQPQYGTLGDRMRAKPEIVELLSPSTRSPRKKALLSPSPVKNRRGVRRSEAAEVVVPLPATPRARAARPELPSPAVTPLPAPIQTVATRPAFEVELHVTTFDTASMTSEPQPAESQAEEANTAEASPLEEEQVSLPFSEHVDDIQVEEAPDQEPVVLAEHEAVASRERMEVATEAVEQSYPQHEPSAVTEDVVIAAGPDVGAAALNAAPTASEEEIEVKSPEATNVSSASPAKPRTSRRAASASPTKRTARTASPVKRSVRSSPVKRVPAAAAEAFARGAAEDSTAQLSGPAHEEPETETKPEQRSQEIETPTKPMRRLGGRKAKQAATEAITATLLPELPQAALEKPTRRTQAAASKKVEAEEQRVQEEQVEGPAEGEKQVEAGGQEAAEEEAPKRATRARATRATAAKPVRSTRTRAATKSAGPALPSSSAGYGDDEASEEDEPAPAARTKRSTAAKQADTSPTKPAASSRTARTRTAAASRTKTTRSTRDAVAPAAAESSETEEVPEGHNERDMEEEEEELPKTKARARAPPRSTRTKAATSTSTTSTVSRGRSRAKAELDPEEVLSSSSVTTATTTTRAGRPRRAAASGK